MPKRAAHAAKLANIRRLCLSADSMHVETAKLVAELSRQPRHSSSAKAALKPKRRR
jgi:hypothetical protein